METLHKDNALSLEHMRQAIHNAGGRFYQYRPCRRDASTVYDIENIRHDVVYAQTPLNMNDPFDSMIGFSTEKIYSECIAMTLDALDLTSTNRVILSILLKYRAFGKMAQLISCIKDIQTYLKSRQKATHQTMIPLDAYVCRDMHSLYSKAPKNLKAVFNGEEFSVLAWLSAKLSPMNISEKAITEMLHIEGLLDQLQQQVEEMRDSKYGPLLRAFLSKITVSCFSASGWNNPLMWSHYANSYTGICVEYDFEKIEDFIGFAHPVSYTTVRPTLSMADLGIAAVDLKSKDRLVKEDVDVERIISYLCCKNKCWQYEDEWRIINIGEENTPQFIKLPCVKSITFGPNVDSLCKRLLLEVCKSKGISCYDLRLNHENYGVERIPITNNAEYDINEEAEYISLLSAQLTKWMQIMQTNSEKIVIEINSHTFALGTLLRVSYSGSTSDEHTMILVGRDSTGVIIYHANWPDNGTVAISHVTWSGFAQTFPYLDFIICPHNVNVWKPYSSTQHRGACTACGTYLYGSHYAQVGGMGTCLVCGYYGNMPGLTSTGHETE